MCILDKIPYFARRRAIREYDALVEKSVQSHWPDYPIKMKYLVWEQWAARPADGSELETHNFIVFIDINCDIDWITDDDHSKMRVSSETKNRIDEAMSVEALPCKHLPMAERMAFKKIIGAAIVAALHGDYETAKMQTAKAKEYLDKRTPEQSRLWTICCATAGVLSACLLLSRMTWCIKDIQPLLYGALGSYLAIAYRSSIAEKDASAGLPLHICEALVKILAGMIQGKVCVVFITSTLAPEMAAPFATSSAALAIVAFSAGLVDKFAPNLISNYVVKPFDFATKEAECDLQP